jgi:amino acid transporter
MSSSHPATLKPVLGLAALTLFGVAFVGPIAPYLMFGLGSAKSNGHLTLVYLIATIAMSFTAVSFGRMANAYPSAGSTYTYASRELHPVAGYFAGWVMVLDYVLLPAVCVLLLSLNAHALVPQVPHAVWAVAAAVLITGLNLRGIELTTRFMLGYAALCAVSMIWFVVAASQALLSGVGEGALLSMKPLYDPEHFTMDAVRSAFAVAVLSFLGFDGISTLAEDARNPRKDIPHATVLSCVSCGACFLVLTYFGQMAWPRGETFTSQEKAFSDIGALVGGRALSGAISFLVLGQAFVASVASVASGSRLLYGMARDGRLPGRVFGYIHPTLQTPVYSVLILGALAAVVPVMVGLDETTELVNFGAGLGFVAVNLSALARAVRNWRSGAGAAFAMLFPAVGSLICLGIWISLSPAALKLGLAWTLLGGIYYVRVIRLRRPVIDGPLPETEKVHT